MRKLFVVATVPAVAAVVIGVAWSQAVGRAGPPLNLEHATAERLHHSVNVGETRWTLKTFTNTDGRLCVRRTATGKDSSGTCVDPGVLATRGVLVMPGASQDPEKADGKWDNQWVWGLASRAVSTVELLSTDCSTRALELVDGTFMYVVPQAAIEVGAVPYRVTARNAAGIIVFSKVIALAPPATAQAPQPVAPALAARCSE
jgi:hypothetical protein